MFVRQQVEFGKTVHRSRWGAPQLNLLMEPPGILGLGRYHDHGEGQLSVKSRYEIGLGGVEEHCLVLGSGRG